MLNEITLPCTILEVVRDKEWTIEGKTGKSASLLVRLGGVIVKIKADNNAKEFLDEAQKTLDNDVDIKCKVSAGQGLALVLRAFAFV